MTCIAEGGPIRFEVNDEVLSIAHGDDFPTRLRVDGEIVTQNGSKPQYIVNLGVLEYFVDFNTRSASSDLLRVDAHRLAMHVNRCCATTSAK